MGDARNNPRSPQYRGPLPENVIIPEIQPGTVIDPEWLAANPPVDGVRPEPPDTAIILQFFLVANWIRPSQLAPREKWPTQKVGLLPLAQLTMAEFKELAAAQELSRQGAEQGTSA